MKKFILKFILYVFLILVALEILVRIFHLYTEDPPRYIDKYGVEKRVPEHNGYAVTGNRNQNFSEFHINEAGFNSYREFTPTKEKFEIALIGDSFIEGFHQDYYASTGKKIEENLHDGTEVYEYGYAGYDLANEMYLVHAYQKDFKLIDEIILYLNYENLVRGKYTPDRDRISMLSSTIFRIRDNIKLLAYGSKIGILEPLKRLVTGRAFEKDENDAYETNEINSETPEEKAIKDRERLDNFKSLVTLYGYDKTKTTILLDSRKTSRLFLDYCDKNGYKYLDFAPTFEKSLKPTTLIYDWHWNNHGRDLIAKVVSDYVKKKKGL